MKNCSQAQVTKNIFFLQNGIKIYLLEFDRSLICHVKTDAAKGKKAGKKKGGSFQTVSALFRVMYEVNQCCY